MTTCPVRGHEGVKSALLHTMFFHVPASVVKNVDPTTVSPVRWLDTLDGRVYWVSDEQGWASIKPIGL